MAEQGRKTVVLVNIEKGTLLEGIFNDMYKGLLDLLKGNINIRLTTVNSIDELTAKVIQIKPDVLLFTNEFVAQKKNQRVIDTILKPFLDGGGLAVLGCHFSSMRTDDMDRFFNSLGLPWKHAAYHRTTFGITSFGKSILANIPENGKLVTEKFSVKAVQLSNVEPGQLLYSPVVGGRTESHVFPPEPTNPNLAMAAFARIGNGAVAYVGDVNAEQESNCLTVALCLVNY